MVRTTKEYTVRYPVRIEAASDETGLMLYGITSEDKGENALLDAESGEYACWDSSVEFVVGGIEINGADAPCGGAKYHVRLFVPQGLVREFRLVEM